MLPKDATARSSTISSADLRGSGAHAGAPALRTDSAPESHPGRRDARALLARVLAEAAPLVLLSLVVAAAFVWTDPPLYNPAGSIDPWFYTGFWLNFHQLYDAFSQTYYASRLPWIIVGYAANQILSPRTAHLVLHGSFFVVGAVAAYGLLRAHFGRNAALIGYVWLIGGQMYFDAQHWDYWDGALITFVFVGLFLGLPATGKPLPVWRLAASGFFLAAAVATNVFAVVLVIGLPILYVTTRMRPRGMFLRRLGIDSAAFLSGAVALLVACGTFAWLNRGPVWFLGPQIHEARVINPALFSVPFDTWAPQSPRVLVPLFLLAILVVVAAGSKRRTPEFGSIVGSGLYLLAVSAFLAARELHRRQRARGGLLLQPGPAGDATLRRGDRFRAWRRELARGEGAARRWSLRRSSARSPRLGLPRRPAVTGGRGSLPPGRRAHGGCAHRSGREPDASPTTWS